MGELPGKTAGRRSSIRQVAFASFIGTTIETYDFLLYATAAALVFPKLFFPNFSPLAGTLASFATFGVGFFARPMGAIVFGHFGDRVGRKSMLLITLLLMGIATFLVGLLPTFKEIGLLAPALLTMLRFLQGFAFGGEWGGATLMAVEHAPEESRNFYGSLPQQGVPCGLILSTGVFATVSSLSNEHFLSWGWRIPFLLTVVLIGVGLFIRMRVVESPEFKRVKDARAEFRLPVLELLRRYPVAAILATGMTSGNFTAFYVVNTFALTYVTGRFGVARNVPLVGLLLSGAAEFMAILTVARLADRVGTRTVAIWSTGCMVLLCYPFFRLLDTGQPVLIWLAMSTLAAAVGAVYSVTGVLLADLFETRVRYSGISFGYQAGGLIGGAPAPIISTALVHWTGGASWPVAAYLVGSLIVVFISACLISNMDRAAIFMDAVRPESTI